MADAASTDVARTAMQENAAPFVRFVTSAWRAAGSEASGFADGTDTEDVDGAIVDIAEMTRPLP